MSQLELVHSHLQNTGKISSWEAIQSYRITRLAEYIRQLREKGLAIKSEWRENNGKNFVEYILEKKVEPSGQYLLV